MITNTDTSGEDEIKYTPLRRLRFEVEPRPAALGGGWRLHLIAADPETGAEIEAGGGVFFDLDRHPGQLEESRFMAQRRPSPEISSRLRYLGGSPANQASPVSIAAAWGSSFLRLRWIGKGEWA